MSALATSSAVEPRVPNARAGAEYAPPLVHVLEVSPGQSYESFDVTEAPTCSSWPYQPSGMGRLIPLSPSVTAPLSTRGASDPSGAGSPPPEPPEPPESPSDPPEPPSCPPSRPPGPCEVAVPPPPPSSVSAYTPTPML